MAKFCMCGMVTCPICKGNPATSGFSVSQVVGKTKRKAPYGFGRNANIPAPEPENVNVPVAPPVSANIPVTARRTPVRVTVEEEGAIAVDCACGCGEKVWLKPAYYSSACRSRAWRKKKVE